MSGRYASYWNAFLLIIVFGGLVLNFCEPLSKFQIFFQNTVKAVPKSFNIDCKPFSCYQLFAIYLNINHKQSTEIVFTEHCVQLRNGSTILNFMVPSVQPCFNMKYRTMTLF